MKLNGAAGEKIKENGRRDRHARHYTPPKTM